MISLIVAKSTNDVIGKDNDLPWHLPADLKHFKDLTTGHTVIMGRKTYESILARLGKPLPNRRNIVVSRSLESAPAGFEIYHSLDDALQSAGADDRAYIIGGTTLFKTALEQNLADEIQLTQIHADIDGDTFFPPLEATKWEETERGHHAADAKNPYDYDFVVLKRK